MRYRHPQNAIPTQGPVRKHSTAQKNSAAKGVDHKGNRPRRDSTTRGIDHKGIRPQRKSTTKEIDHKRESTTKGIIDHKENQRESTIREIRGKEIDHKGKCRGTVNSLLSTNKGKIANECVTTLHGTPSAERGVPTASGIRSSLLSPGTTTVPAESQTHLSAAAGSPISRRPGNR